MTPIAGLDKVTVLLAPYIFNKYYFDNMKHPEPYNKITIVNRGFFYLMSVHIEYVDLMKDYHLVLAEAIYDLMFLKTPYYNICKIFIKYIYENLNFFIVGVNCIEIFFSMLRKNVNINREAIKNGKLLQFNENGEYTYSYYSTDYKVKRVKNTNNKTPDKETTKKVIRHSRVHIYDKKNKDLLDNHIKYSDLGKNPYEIRIEFKLFRDNCNFISLDNLKGTWIDILLRYIELLATIFNRYIKNNIEITGRNNIDFNKIVRKAKTVGKRYTGKKLIKTVPISKEKMNEKLDDSDQMKHMILEQKYKRYELAENLIDCLKNNKVIEKLAIDSIGE